MYFLAYVSKAKSRKISMDINAILKVATKNNAKHGVTGMLLVRSGIFFQLLEGEKKDVLTIFQKIVKDPRHEKIEILLEVEEAGSDRFFPKWSMGLVDDVDDDFAHQNIIENLYNLVISPKPKKDRILLLLKTFSTTVSMSAQDILTKSIHPKKL
jgi:hypothetical protein